MKKIEKETMRYLKVTGNSRQRHEGWRLRFGVICNCVYGNEEENGMIDNVEEVRVLGTFILEHVGEIMADTIYYRMILLFCYFLGIGHFNPLCRLTYLYGSG